jgi:hypothetical protein
MLRNGPSIVNKMLNSRSHQIKLHRPKLMLSSPNHQSHVVTYHGCGPENTAKEDETDRQIDLADLMTLMELSKHRTAGEPAL